MTGLVLEGGGHRGIYTAGVLDVFIENKIKVDGVIGVSAGAIHGASFVAGQVGRSVRYTEKYCNNKDYMSWGSLFRTGDLFNSDFCYRLLPEQLDPFDNIGFEKATIPYYTVCTDVNTGEAVYHQSKSLRGDEIKWIQASASMPLVARPVNIDGQLLLDGGMADSIPVRKFEEMGFEKNIVVLTQEEGYVKKPNKAIPLISAFYKKYPKLVEVTRNRHINYNESIEYLKQLEIGEKAFVIRPSQKPMAGRLEKDPAKIRLTYELGRRDALNALHSIRVFLTGGNYAE